jgi:Mce-associated membrane protein
MAEDVDPADGQLSESRSATSASDLDPTDDVDRDDVTANTGAAGSRVRMGLAAGLIAVLALAGLGAWLGYRGYESHRVESQRQLFLQVGRQGALNLTTIDWEHADADIKRILESATGPYYNDFSQRSKPFVDVVERTKSKSVGAISESGIESASGDGAQVLVAVLVKTSNATAAEQPSRSWRMRISVQNVGDNEAKVSNVTFVP